MRPTTNSDSSSWTSFYLCSIVFIAIFGATLTIIYSAIVGNGAVRWTSIQNSFIYARAYDICQLDSTDSICDCLTPGIPVSLSKRVSMLQQEATCICKWYSDSDAPMNSEPLSILCLLDLFKT